MTAARADSARILMVEDAPEEASLISACLAGHPFDVRHAATARAALAALADEAPDAVLLDLGLPDMDGREVLRKLMARNGGTSVIVLTGNARLDVAVEAMRLGAFDYIVKPFDPGRLVVTLRNAVERQRLSRLVTCYRERYEEDRFHGFIGSSPAMRAVYRTIEAAAASRATIFVTGESGTGKELCAAAIHALSARRGRPLIAINCAAIPAGIIESELFGHTRGAFTGAVAGRRGAVARADGGTLFFDEICDMPPELQTKLLRLMQTGAYQKVGADNAETADLRFVCATNRDPWREVEAGRFREDLYYRMHVIPIELPPLRARGGDISILAAHFLAEYAAEEGKSFAGLTPEVEAAFAAHGWPGNVRELQNVIRRIVVLNDGELVTADMLPPLFARAPVPVHLAAENGARRPFVARTAPSSDGVRPLWLIEREAIEQAIESCDGNLRRAAELLGVDRATIYRKRRSWRAAVPDPAEGGAALCLDGAALRALEKALGSDTMRGLVERHIGDFGERLDMLRGAGAAGAAETVAREAHEIKSLAAAFGAVVVQAIAAELERACEEKSLLRALALVPRLAEAGETALAALARRYRLDCRPPR